MPPNLAKGESIPWLIRDLLNEKGRVSSGDVARAAGVTRQAAHYHLSRLAEAGEIDAVGAGRGSHYVAAATWMRQFETAGLQEHLVWQQLSSDLRTVAGLPQEAFAIARYAFTEILNNAIDHSGSATVSASATVTDEKALFSITDVGVGAFERVRRTKQLEDHLAAVQEIAKGKLTTDPARHSGQGIFFTSKAVDEFVLTSNGLRWRVDNVRGDESIARVRPSGGTQVQLQVDPHTRLSLTSVFDRYTDAETFAFDKTRTVVRLFEYDSTFVSRSEAKRLTRNLEKFSEVVVDFRGVEEVGQGFADEVFRVWQRDHPAVRLIPVDMTEPVRRLVEQARANYGRI